MPEGPEYRLTVDYLNKALRGKKVMDWVFCGGGYTEEDPDGFQDFDDALPLTVKEVACKGKLSILRSPMRRSKSTTYYIA